MWLKHSEGEAEWWDMRPGGRRGRGSLDNAEPRQWAVVITKSVWGHMAYRELTMGWRLEAERQVRK